MLLTLLILALPACVLLGYFLGCIIQAGEMREEIDGYRRVELKAYRRVSVVYRVNGRQTGTVASSAEVHVN